MFLKCHSTIFYMLVVLNSISLQSINHQIILQTTLLGRLENIVEIQFGAKNNVFAIAVAW